MLKSSCTQTLRCGVLESHVTIQEFYPEDIKTNLGKWGCQYDKGGIVRSGRLHVPLRSVRQMVRMSRARVCRGFIHTSFI